MTYKYGADFETAILANANCGGENVARGWRPGTGFSGTHSVLLLALLLFCFDLLCFVLFCLFFFGGGGGVTLHGTPCYFRFARRVVPCKVNPSALVIHGSSGVR